MATFIVSRLIQSIPLVLGATIVIFAMMRLIPGDPAQVLAGPEASAEQVAQAREHLGLDRPLPLQYLTWIGNVAQGDLGESYISRRPVTELIQNRGPATLQLAGAALLLTVAVAIPLGILAAVRAGGVFDWMITSVTGLVVGIPSFWAGLLLLLLFASYLGWLPAGGRGSFSADPVDALKHLLLPALVLASGTISTLTRLVRAAMLEALYEDYVRTARAKGLTESRVIVKHVLRNALVPVITVIGLQIGNLLGGSVILEVVFAWPGIGRMIIDALSSRDYQVIQGALLVLVFVYIIINLVTDIAYGLVDPRIRVS